MKYITATIKIFMLAFLCILNSSFGLPGSGQSSSKQQKVSGLLYSDTVFQGKKISICLTQSNYVKVIISDKNITTTDSTEYFFCDTPYPLSTNKAILSYDGYKTQECNFLYCGNDLYAVSIYNEVSDGILCFVYKANKITIVRRKDGDRDGYINTRGAYVFFDIKNRILFTKGYLIESKNTYYRDVAFFGIENNQYVYIKQVKDLTESKIKEEFKDNEEGEYLYLYKKYFDK